MSPRSTKGSRSRGERGAAASTVWARRVGGPMVHGSTAGAGRRGRTAGQMRWTRPLNHGERRTASGTDRRHPASLTSLLLIRPSRSSPCSSTVVAPGLVLAGQPFDQGDDRWVEGWVTAAVRVGPLLGHQPTVPAQDRGRDTKRCPRSAVGRRWMSGLSLWGSRSRPGHVTWLTASSSDWVVAMLPTWQVVGAGRPTRRAHQVHHTDDKCGFGVAVGGQGFEFGSAPAAG